MANTLVRLDRGLANAEWCLNFSDAGVENIPRTASDHCPIIIRFKGIAHNYTINRPFRLLACWFDRHDFNDIVKISWNNSDNLETNLKQCSKKICNWNKVTYGNIFKNKKCILRCLSGIQKAQ